MGIKLSTFSGDINRNSPPYFAPPIAFFIDKSSRSGAQAKSSRSAESAIIVFISIGLVQYEQI
jgi:hypothetical protein